MDMSNDRDSDEIKSGPNPGVADRAAAGQLATLERWVDERDLDLDLGTRSVISLIVALVVALTATMVMSGGAAAHTTFTADDVTVTSNNGQIMALTVAPAGDIHYWGLESAGDVNIAVETRQSGGTWEQVAEQNQSVSSLEGSLEYSFSTIDLLAESSISRVDFNANRDGGTSTNDIEIRVRATFIGAGDNGADIVTTTSDSFTVTVDNVGAGLNGGGNANTNGAGT